MRILGIDPGSRFTGWGLVEQVRNTPSYLASGTIRLKPDAPLAERLVVLARELEAVLETHRPETCALEQIFSARNARSALVLGHARGVILQTVATRSIPVMEYTATQVKQAVTGTGRAGKSQVQKMVSLLLSRREALQEDEADALAVALTHAAMSRIRLLT
ncbi:MAG: crossover junction endodeoxyribonuclease RuvC [Deltaproteobacteria bacterium]|nr:crossover junction endodeoxyribonuclease RuvC [Deltaproteobacteria bacterium]